MVVNKETVFRGIEYFLIECPGFSLSLIQRFRCWHLLRHYKKNAEPDLDRAIVETELDLCETMRRETLVKAGIQKLQQQSRLTKEDKKRLKEYKRELRPLELTYWRFARKLWYLRTSIQGEDWVATSADGEYILNGTVLHEESVDVAFKHEKF